jgi:hypothetical protein
MSEQEFQERAERLADAAAQLANELRALNQQAAVDVGETKRYIALARTAAQESELWLGRAMVAHAGRA